MSAAKRTLTSSGYGEKQAVRIITVDPERNRVECATRDGAMIFAAVWETPAVFRWPEVGETWTVRKDSGVWRLDQIVQTSLAEQQSSSVPKALSDLPEGDARVLGNAVHMNEVVATGVVATDLTSTNLTTTNASAESLVTKALTTKTLTVEEKLVGGSGWITVTFENSWTNWTPLGTFSPAAYRKGVDGKVTLRGLIKREVAGANGTVPFTLPVGYRPTGQEIFLVHENNAGFARVDVQANGQFLYSGSATTVADMSISGISFYTD